MAGSSTILLLVQVWICCIHSGESIADWNDETKLRNVLFVQQTIDKHSRPIQYHNETIEVDMDLLINHVLQLNERTEVLSLNVWLFQMWEDMHFKWSPDDYGGLSYLAVSTSQIWMPDIYLLNSAKAVDTQPVANVSAIITYYGHVYWFPPATLHTVCPLDLKNFPFDEQKCVLRFCSWSYWGERLNLTMSFQNLSLTPYLFDEHNEWQIINSFGNRNVVYYGSFSYITAEFHVHLRRRAPYYSLSLIAPTIIAMLMTLATFWIPPFAGEKFLLGGMSEVILTLLLAHLYWVVPRSGSNVPGIIILCGNAMMFAGISIVIALIVMLISRKKPLTSPPAFITALLSGSAKNILCLPEKETTVSSNSQLLNNEEGQDDSAAISEQQEKSFEWLLLATAVDRIAFFLYAIIFCILIVATYG